MKPPVFRVSEVESFRQYSADPDAELSDLLARMRGQTEPSERMLAGTAFHHMLELAIEGDSCEDVFIDDHWFHFSEPIDIALPAIRELRADKTYETAFGPITITGQLDAIEGRTVVDHKTTGQFNPDRYLDGAQWRMYLDIFGANVFRWNVFEIARMKPDRTWNVKGMQMLEQCRYPALQADCYELASNLALFAREHIPERFT